MVFAGHADVGQGSMNKASELRIRGMERVTVTGIEPALSAWEAGRLRLLRALIC